MGDPNFLRLKFTTMKFKKFLGLIGFGAVAAISGMQSMQLAQNQMQAKQAYSNSHNGYSKGANNNQPVRSVAAVSATVSKDVPRGRISPTYFGRGCSPMEWGIYLRINKEGNRFKRGKFPKRFKC
jgi:hypothetical protein